MNDTGFAGMTGKLTKTEIDELICLKYPQIRRYFYKRLSVSDDRDDLAQETISLAYKHFLALKDIANIDAWIYKIAKNVYIKYIKALKEDLKRKTALGETLDIEESNSPTWYDLGEYLEEAESAAELQKLIDELGEPYTAVFHWHYADGLKLVEIAEQKNMNLNTVKSIHSRGLKKLKSALKTE